MGSPFFKQKIHERVQIHKREAFRDKMEEAGIKGPAAIVVLLRCLSVRLIVCEGDLKRSERGSALAYVRACTCAEQS